MYYLIAARDFSVLPDRALVPVTLVYYLIAARDFSVLPDSCQGL